MSENTHPEYQQIPSKDDAPEKEPVTGKESLRKVVGEAVGLVVGASSVLAGDSALLTEAEQTVAAEKTEEFIDRIDGEG